MHEANKKDFFVSYNHRDEVWAEWIAWALEAAGYSVVVQVWDFRPGNNFVLAMQEAAEQAERTIAVMSENYLGSQFVKPEWAAAFANDPAGKQASLVPVRVGACDIPGMLGQISYIDLLGLDEAIARDRLLAGLKPGRAKPASPPPFPGQSKSDHSSATVHVTPETVSNVSWRALREPLEVQWHEAFEANHFGWNSSHAVFEIQLVPESAQRLEVRRLNSLSGELVNLGRQHGLFDVGGQVNQRATDQVAMAYADVERDRDASGLLVTRSGQRGAWFTLPHDNMGSVFDAADVSVRLEAVINLLLTLPVPEPDAIGVAARVEPMAGLQLESVRILQGRTSATFPFSMRSVEPVLADDAIAFSQIGQDVAAFSAEIVARVESRLRAAE